MRFLTDMQCSETVAAKTDILNSREYQFNVKVSKLWKTWKYKNLTMKIANLGIIHWTIKSAGRRYTFSLLVNYTGNPGLRSFCYSMLHPTVPVENISYFVFIRERKKSSIRRQWLPAKDLWRLKKKLTNYEHLALSKIKKANPSFFRASLALYTLLLQWKTHRIYGANWFTCTDKK